MRIRFDSPFYRAWSTTADAVILSVLTLAGCLPLVTAGAALVACARVAGRMVGEEDPAVAREWWRSFRGNLVASLAWWLPVLVLAVVAGGMNLWLVQAGGQGTVSAELAAGLRGLVGAGALLVLGVLVWLVPLVAFFENTVARHVANAARLAVGYLGRTVVCLVLVLGLPALGWRGSSGGLVPALVVGWFLVLLGPGLVAYLAALVQQPVMSALSRSAA